MGNPTPGPWEVAEDGDIQANGGFDFVARIYNSGDFPCIEDDAIEVVDAEAEANARLIAAAPDLLAALRKWLHHAEGNRRTYLNSKGEDVPLVVETRAAIARATGES